jgi:hypothetical protein
MKSAFLLPVIVVVALSSCTTAYKTGQTPDDVYYSKARPEAEDKKVREDDRQTAYNDEYYDDRYLRMKVRNRYQWNDLNDWYSYDRYSNGYNYAFGSYNNPYNSWHYYYNPYCCCQGTYYGYNNPKTSPVRSVVRPTNFNLGSYTNTSYNNTNASVNGKTVIRSGSLRPVYNNSNNSNNNGKGLSNTIRTIFSGNNNNNNSSSGSSSSSSRTYTPSNNNSSSSSSSGSSSSSSGSSSSGSSGGSVSRPGRN